MNRSAAFLHLAWLVGLVVSLCLLGAPTGWAAKPTPVILDTDIGDDIDDTWALGFLLRCPELDLKLVVGDQGKGLYRAKLIAKFLEAAGRTDVPVGCALEVNAHGSGPQAQWVKDYNLNAYPGRVHADGVQALIDTVMRSAEPIAIIAIGPAPNLAAALDREPRIAQKARFVGMHGSVRLGYGGSKEIAAEYNVKADAKACQKVFTAPWPMLITPLDTCGLVDLRGARYARVRDSQDPVARAVVENYRAWSQARDPRNGARKAEEASSTLFDTVAVYLALAQDLVKVERLGLRVDDQGFTRLDPQAKEVDVATEWKDLDRFRDLLVDRLTGAAPNSTGDEAATRRQASEWRAERRLIDLHQHIGPTEAFLARAVKIMDANGIGVGVNLSGGVVTHKPGEASEFERNRNLAERLYPGRFLQYVNLDYTGWDEPDFSARAVAQIEEAHRLGAAGFKEFKRLGLGLRDGAGKLIRVDDPKLDPLWRRCGELGMPVSIHVADPKAFWAPFDASNERWTELKDHKNWWFGDPEKHPAWRDLLDALARVVARHPETAFVCVHFANDAEELATVEGWLDRYPNMMADLAARIPEIGRHDPEAVRRLFLKHQDRILFGTDFQVYDRLILGSGGSGPAPTDEDAGVFFDKHWRWLETRDRGFAHMTPIQGDWTIDAIGLPVSVLRKIYFDNARKLLARSLPKPRLRAARIAEDYVPDAQLGKPGWNLAQPVHLERGTKDASARPDLSTLVRARWSDRFLYLWFECPYTQLTEFRPPSFEKKRMGLWERDVVEAFIGASADPVNRYKEFQVAPTGERLDLALALPERDFEWTSGFEAAVQVDAPHRKWYAEWRIPLSAISPERPQPGDLWRINLLRCDYANQAFLAWNPSLSGTFHVPERFGLLEFVEN